MTGGILLDTHIWAWSMSYSARLSQPAKIAFMETDVRAVSPVSVFEIAQKVRLGNWPEMDALLSTLVDAVSEQSAVWADITPEIAHLAGTLDWPHRDPFDRLIAATALVHGWVLISADTAFDSLTGLRRIW